MTDPFSAHNFVLNVFFFRLDIVGLLYWCISNLPTFSMVRSPEFYYFFSFFFGGGRHFFLSALQIWKKTGFKQVHNRVYIIDAICSTSLLKIVIWGITLSIDNTFFNTGYLLSLFTQSKFLIYLLFKFWWFFINRDKANIIFLTNVGRSIWFCLHIHPCSLACLKRKKPK